MDQHIGIFACKQGTICFVCGGSESVLFFVVLVDKLSVLFPTSVVVSSVDVHKRREDWKQRG